MKDAPAQFIPAVEGSSAGEAGRIAHWSQMLQCSNGQFVHGYGATNWQAEENAARARDEREWELQQAPKDQIRAILMRIGKQRIYDEDMQRLIRLVCEVVGR